MSGGIVHGGAVHRTQGEPPGGAAYGTGELNGAAAHQTGRKMSCGSAHETRMIVRNKAPHVTRGKEGGEVVHGAGRLGCGEVDQGTVGCGRWQRTGAQGGVTGRYRVRWRREKMSISGIG